MINNYGNLLNLFMVIPRVHFSTRSTRKKRKVPVNCALLKWTTGDATHLTRSSADADNRLDVFSGQSRSTNMVPFHMLHMV